MLRRGGQGSARRLFALVREWSKQEPAATGESVRRHAPPVAQPFPAFSCEASVGFTLRNSGGRRLLLEA